MIDLDKLEAIAKAAPQGEWEVWTSNSWRRVMARDKGDVARVIEPTTHPMDKWPDLIFGSGVEAYLEAMQPATILALIVEVRAARAEGNRSLIDGDQCSTTVSVPQSSVTCEVAGVTIFGQPDNVVVARGALEASTPHPDRPGGSHDAMTELNAALTSAEKELSR